MGLYERLCGEESPRISSHDLDALLGEFIRGKITAQQAYDQLVLSAVEQTELQTLVGKLVLPRESVTMLAIPAGHTLTNVGATYDAIAGSQNMGYAHIQVAGVTQVIFSVRVNKIGSGTQSWQLWNDTDGSEVTVINDSGATGIKFLSVTQDFGSPLAAGNKILRVRAKSTTAADDPIIFGATINFARAAVLSQVELHEILLLAGRTGSPYSTSTALKTRLGV